MMKVPPLQVDEIVQRAKEREIIQFWEDCASYGNLKYLILTTYMFQQRTMAFLKKWAKDKYGVEIIEDFPKRERGSVLFKHGNIDYLICIYYDFMVEVNLNEDHHLVYHEKFWSLPELLTYLGNILEGQGDGRITDCECCCGEDCR